jgi:hypothetical protein
MPIKNTASIKTVIPQSILARPPESGSKFLWLTRLYPAKDGSQILAGRSERPASNDQEAKKKLVHLRARPDNQAHPDRHV